MHVEIAWMISPGPGSTTSRFLYPSLFQKVLPIVIHKDLLEQGIEVTSSGRLNPYCLYRILEVVKQ